jgi:hypothetical protein
MNEGEHEDKTSKNEFGADNDGFEDDAFGTIDDEEKDDKDEAEGEETDGDDKKDEDEKDSDKDLSPEIRKRLSTLARQKARWREKAKEALKTKPGEKAGDEREQQAKNTLRKLLQEISEEEKSIKTQQETERLEAFEEELEVAVERSSFDETAILDACEKYDVTPKAAVRILKDLQGKKSVEKPKLPKSKRASGVEKKDEAPKPKTMAEARKSALARLASLTKEA